MAESKFRLKLPQFKLGEEGSKTRLYILLGVLVVLIIVAIAANLALRSKPQAPPVVQGDPGLAGLEKDLAELLPQLERNEMSDNDTEERPLLATYDPFALPLELLGVVSGKEAGDGLAIIKARQTTYIVAPGEKIAGGWELVEVNRHSVRLTDTEKEIVIELGKLD